MKLNGLVASFLATSMLISCTPAVRYFGQGLLFGAADREIARMQSRQGSTQNFNQSMPRVVYAGKVNGDGKDYWLYNDGLGNRHWALRDGNHFVYETPLGWEEIPGKFLIIKQ